MNRPSELFSPAASAGQNLVTSQADLTFAERFPAAHNWKTPPPLLERHAQHKFNISSSSPVKAGGRKAESSVWSCFCATLVRLYVIFKRLWCHVSHVSLWMILSLLTHTVYQFYIYESHQLHLIISSGQRTENLSATAWQATKLPGAFATTRHGPQDSQEER